MNNQIYAPLELAQKLAQAGWEKPTIYSWQKIEGVFYLHTENQSRLHAKMLKDLSVFYKEMSDIYKVDGKKHIAEQRFNWGKSIAICEILNNVFDDWDTVITPENYIFEGYENISVIFAPTLGEIELPEGVSIEKEDGAFYIFDNYTGYEIGTRHKTELEARAHAWIWANKKEVQDV